MNNFFLRWLIALLVSPGLCYAQATSSSRMQQAVAGLIQQKAMQRGFAANDPRIPATLQAASSSIIGTAAAAAVVTAAGVTAPAWITVAAVTGLGALFTYGISLAIDMVVSWVFNNDGSIGVLVPLPGSAAMNVGGTYWDYNGRFAGDPFTALSSAVRCPGGYCSDAHNTYTLERCTMINDGMATCMIRTRYPSMSCEQYDCENWWKYAPTLTAYRRDYGAQMACPAGSYSDGWGACSGAPSNAVNGGATTKTATDAIAALSAADKAKPINPQILASLADLVWQKAAQQPNYSGVPYDASKPITAADAQAMQTANPSSYPTVDDATAPQSTPSTGGSPFELPMSSTSSPPGTGTGTDGGTTNPPASTPPAIDWTIASTGESIGKQSVAVSYTPTIFAAPTGCPAPVSFIMFGKPYSIAYAPFCDLMATLAPIFLALGAAAAALIFAEALKS